MKLNALTGLSEQAPGVLGSTVVKGLASNSADVQPGFVFFGLPGTNVDGARFVEQAEALGACAAVVSDQSVVGPVGIPLLRSNDPQLRRLLPISASENSRWRSCPQYR